MTIREVGKRTTAYATVLVLVSALAALVAQESAPGMVDIAGQGMMNNRAFQYLAELTDEIGGRVTGTLQARQAIAWGVSKMKAIGLSDVHTETWQMPIGWTRVAADMELLEPVRRRLQVDSMGWVGSTPAAGVDAEVVGVNIYHLAQELRNARGWEGKVLLALHQGTPPDRSTLTASISAFIKTAFEAHAVAIIGGDGLSVAAGTHLTHTFDNAHFFCTDRNFCDIPLVSMVREDHLQLERLLTRPQPVRVRVNVQNLVTGPVNSANVVGEIRGREHPEQVVVVGAHLDSWDLGQGAIDNGFGVAAVLGAAEAIRRSGHEPRRTIRFVLFTGEEQGLLGSRAYVKQHGADLKNHLGAIVMDTGQGPVTGFSLGREDLVTSLRPFVATLAGFGSLVVNGNVCGTDCLPFIESGLPGINLMQSTPDFVTLQHSAADTLDKIDPAVLVRNSTVMALTAFWIADRAERWAAPLGK